jgi:hypothetical protein
MRFDEHDVAATGFNLGGDALATLDITIGKGYLRPFGDEAPHGRLTNPRSPTSDGGNFPTELSHRHYPPTMLCYSHGSLILKLPSKNWKFIHKNWKFSS